MSAGLVGRGKLEGDSEIEISMLVVTEMVPELIPRASHWDLINISMYSPSINGILDCRKLAAGRRKNTNVY